MVFLLIARDAYEKRTIFFIDSFILSFAKIIIV